MQAGPDIIFANKRLVTTKCCKQRLVNNTRVKQIGMVEAMSKVVLGTKMRNCKAIK